MILKEVIRENKVSSQEELSALLEQRGLSVAQATLSRDIREMRISKMHDESGYFYQLPQAGSPRSIFLESISTADSIESLEFSGTMAVLKTKPGHANMIAAIIDGSHLREILGTLAGDDTILLIIRERFSHLSVTRSLGQLFKGIESKTID